MKQNQIVELILTAEEMGLEPVVVEAFHDLFSNALDRRNEPGNLALFVVSAEPLERLVLRAGLDSTIENYMRLVEVGFTPVRHHESAAASQCQ